MLYLDLTSSCQVYNPVSPQGHWEYHKFGKRNFPSGESDLENIKKVIVKENHKEIICHSFFGDPLYYSKLLDLAEYCFNKDINLMLFTYGKFRDSNLIDELKNFNVKFYIFLSGYKENNTLIYLNSSYDNIEYIFKNVDSNNLFIEYSLYDHNVEDLKKVLDDVLEKQCSIKVSNGNLLGNNFTNILDIDGKWLYDIHKFDGELNFLDNFLQGVDVLSAINNLENLEYKSKELIKSSAGYLLLRTYLYERNYKNIFDVRLEKLDYGILTDPDGDTYINYLDYIFYNRDMYEIFNNSLCDDWSGHIIDENLEYNISNTFYFKLMQKSRDVNSNRKTSMSFNDFPDHKDVVQERTKEIPHDVKLPLILSYLSNQELDDHHISKLF